MKVLVATKRGYGQRDSDLFEAEDGELVFLPLEGDCSVDGPCGCRRSLLGSGLTTTFEVKECEISRDEYIELCRKSMVETGRFTEEEFSEEHWADGLNKAGADPETISFFLGRYIVNADEEAERLLSVADSFEVGTVLERRFGEFFPRVVETTEVEKIRQLIQLGESKTVEFKETMSWDVRKQSKEAHIELSVLKTIAGFLNSDGGTLLIGVTDNGELVGIGAEVSRLHKSKDKFLLYFKNLVKSKIGESFYPNIDSKIEMVDSAEVFIVECSRSNVPCFVEERDFYVRTNPATDKLEGRKQYEYINTHFKDGGRL